LRHPVACYGFTTGPVGNPTSFLERLLLAWVKPPGLSREDMADRAGKKLEAILVSFDGDFEAISPRIPKRQRARFRKLSRIWLRCGEPQAALRCSRVLDFVEREFALTTPTTPMRLTIGKSYLRTDR
jgi:hypothetical protein